MRRRIVGPQPATVSELVNLTARHLAPKAKRNIPGKHNLLERGKDWDNPRIRKILERYAERHLFSNPVSSRAAYEKFVSDAGMLMLNSPSSKRNRDIMKNHLLNFVQSIKTERGMSIGQKVTLVRVSLEHLDRKFSSFYEMVSKEWSEADLKSNPKKGVNPSDIRYYAQNARDAMAHIVGPKMMINADAVKELIEAAKSLELTFRNLR